MIYTIAIYLLIVIALAIYEAKRAIQIPHDEE